VVADKGLKLWLLFYRRIKQKIIQTGNNHKHPDHKQ
jgi:hypothetical protein